MSKINCKGEWLELSIINPIYKKKYIEKKSGGETVLFEKDVCVKEKFTKGWFRKDGIVHQRQYLTSTYEVAKSRSIFFDNYTREEYLVAHSMDDIREHIMGGPVGFK